MHKNLIKVNEMLAFANNNDGVISLISKKSKAYSFEDIIGKEQEIDELSKKVKDETFEKNHAIEAEKHKVICAIQMILDILSFLVLVGLNILMFSINIAIGVLVLLLNFILVWLFKKMVIENEEKKGELRDVKEIEEDLEKVRELLNTKKEELERMLDKVDFREYTDKKQIENIMNNMFSITQSNEEDNTLSKDESNKVSLDGPVLNRKRDL